MPPLPHVRMGPVAPLLHIGVDCFGPMYVRSAKTSEFLVTNFRKVYGILFTCLVTRAIHLEFVEDLSGDQFLQALIRFKSRRGTLKLVVLIMVEILPLSNRYWDIKLRSMTLTSMCILNRMPLIGTSSQRILHGKEACESVLLDS